MPTSKLNDNDPNDRSDPSGPNSFYILEPKTMCHITRQASINAHASIQHSI